MKAIAQNEIITLVTDINAFADRAENLINRTQATYEREKGNLRARQSNAMNGLEDSYQSSCTDVRTKSQKTISEAKRILAEVTKWDEKMTAVDKYYVKTKKKKEEALAGQTSSEYDDATDYFEALDKIRSSYNVLFKKYSEDILPALINGLNYLFSSKRKKDYEDLIVLKNTITLFVSEIEKELPPITQENLAELRESYLTQKGSLTEKHRNESEAFEQKHLITLDDVAGRIWNELDDILPDEFVEYLFQLIVHYENGIAKVNSTTTIVDGVFNMMFVDYPVDFFVQSQIVASIIKEKCAKLLVNGAIRLPIATSVEDAPAWMIMNDNSNQTAVHAFTHSIMYGFLSAIPVSRVTFSIVDPENRGNSISPFFDAKKKLQDLFGERIYINKEDVSVKVTQLNEYIETTLQDKLGNQYATIFDYEREHTEFEAPVELVVLYDFPKGFDERTLAELRNVLRNGSRCGIYVIISYIPSTEGVQSHEYEQSIKTISELSTNIAQSGTEFLYRGLPLTSFGMPEKMEFAKFFSKYMLIFEGIKNRGIAFSPLIKKLVDTKEPAELDKHITYISHMLDGYEKQYAAVPKIGMPFPELVTLGSVLYPADIFSDSIGFQQIVDTFGVGIFSEDEIGYVELPLTFDLKNSFNLFFNCSESNNRNILPFTHHVMWNFLSAMPVTKVNICICDPEQHGNSIMPFLEFRKKCPDVFDQKIYTNADAITERLKKINTQIDEFILEKLGNKYKDILDYNLNTPNRAEPITLLALYDFPSGMDSRSLDLLMNILRNGNKCGVFVLICHNPGIVFSRYDSIEDRLENIMRYCAVVDYKEGQYGLLPYNLKINIPETVSTRTADNFAKEYIDKSEIIKKQGLSFKDILANNLFSMSSAKSLSVPVGIGDGDSIISIKIGEGSSHHGLIAGATGSGKSTLLHTFIMSCMLHYSPDELQLYLMDFKGGTEFKIYESARLPHIQLLALDAMQEFGESILENLVQEIEIRSNAFKGDSSKGEESVSKLADYVAIRGKAMPRIVVIMDEFQILFNDATNRKVAMHCAELTKRIVTEGRSYGIHLFMATQSTRIISDLTLSAGTIEQMRIRIGLKCGENDARYLFSDQNDTKALSMMKGPIGTAVMNLDYTEQANIGFRVAYCDSDTQRYYLDLISSTFADKPYTLQTFEGGRTIKLLDYFRSNGFGITTESPVKIQMGPLIKVADPLEIVIDKKKKHNLLICGSNERMANMISNSYMISAILNKHARVYCIDGDKLVGDDTSQDIYDVLLSATDRFKVADGRSDIIHFIREIYQDYQAWKKQNSNDVIFVVIKNLQFLDIVKTMFKGESFDEGEYVDDEPIPSEEINPADPFAAINNMFANRDTASDNMSAGEKLIKLIEDGSAFGIHFVVTSLDYQTIRETMYYGENILTKFPERIIFSLGGNDADNLVENVSVAGLRDNTVYFTDSVKNTFQMKPYVAPTAVELQEYLNSL